MTGLLPTVDHHENTPIPDVNPTEESQEGDDRPIEEVQDRVKCIWAKLKPARDCGAGFGTNVVTPCFQCMRSVICDPDARVGVLSGIELQLAMSNSMRADSNVKMNLAIATICVTAFATLAKVIRTYSSDEASSSFPKKASIVLNLIEGATSASAMVASAKTGENEKDQKVAHILAWVAFCLLSARAIGEGIRYHKKCNNASVARQHDPAIERAGQVGSGTSGERRVDQPMPQPEDMLELNQEEARVTAQGRVHRTQRPEGAGIIRHRINRLGLTTTSRNTATLDREFEPFVVANSQLMQKEVDTNNHIKRALEYEKHQNIPSALDCYKEQPFQGEKINK